MKRIGSRLLCILLLLSLLLSLTACGKPETQLERTAGYLQAQVAEPGVGSIGGDWLIFGLARSGIKVPQKYFDTYYNNVEAAVREKNGVLSERKYTEYSRTVLALTAIGKILPAWLDSTCCARLRTLNRSQNRASTAQSLRCWHWTAETMKFPKTRMLPCRQHGRCMWTNCLHGSCRTVAGR